MHYMSWLLISFFQTSKSKFYTDNVKFTFSSLTTADQKPTETRTLDGQNSLWYYLLLVGIVKCSRSIWRRIQISPRRRMSVAEFVSFLICMRSASWDATLAIDGGPSVPLNTLKLKTTKSLNLCLSIMKDRFHI